MMRHWGTMFFALAMLLVSGCAFQQQAIRIQPQLEVAESTVGAGRNVRVNVVDERPKSTLGTRGAQGVGSELTIEGDLVATIKGAVEEGLRRHGFVPVQADAGGRELRVEIRNVDYGINVGFWAGTLKVDCSLKGICQRGSLRPYEQLHRNEFKESVQVVQGQEANNRYVSSAVSGALNALLNDRELMQCLATDEASASN
jgi:uncharacterized lipoprotein